MLRMNLKENSPEHSILIENIYGTEFFEVLSLTTAKQTCKGIVLNGRLSVKIPVFSNGFIYYYLLLIYLKVILMIPNIIVAFKNTSLHPNAVFASNIIFFVLDGSISNYTSNFPQALNSKYLQLLPLPSSQC